MLLIGKVNQRAPLSNNFKTYSVVVLFQTDESPVPLILAVLFCFRLTNHLSHSFWQCCFVSD